MSGPGRRPSRVGVAVVVLLGLLVPAWTHLATAAERVSSVAVFPVENLSATGIAAGEVRAALIGTLTSAGVGVLDVEALDAFMTRHRIRWAAGIDAATAGLLKEETGVDGVLFASVDLSNEAVPPKVALVARLVSIEGPPAVVWADDTGMAGDDAPGLLELGMVNDYPALLSRALERLGRSLSAYLEAGTIAADAKRGSKFRPKTSYRRLEIDPGRSYSVAVLPFFNLSERRNAGEIMALLFLRHLSAFPQFRVADTGVVRQELLNARVIMDGGISIPQAETVAALVDADFVLAGRVRRYDDYEGPAGRAYVEFSTVLIEKASRKVVWASDSYNAGNDGVWFFEIGTSRTAHLMATQMVRLATEMIAGDDR